MKKILLILLVVAFSTVFIRCRQQPDKKLTTEDNPAAEGFNLAGSDPAAVQLADSIMKAMGGRNAWDKTHFISWNFFGRRDLVWDKFTGRVRIDSYTDSIVYLLNVNKNEGRVQIKGNEITEPDSLKSLLNRGKSIWINDSYWLVMPFKLKDSGVTLTYLGVDSINNNTLCNILQLTFQNVGDTPQNKYLVYVDVEDNLVKQWAYFQQATQDSATAIWPWDNYKQYGSILLSADRSDGKGPKNVLITESMADDVFEKFEKPVKQ